MDQKVLESGVNINVPWSVRLCSHQRLKPCSSTLFLEAHQGYIISDQIYQSSSLSLRCHSNRAGEKWKYFSNVLVSFYNFKNRALLFVWSIHIMESQHFDPDIVFLFWLNLCKLHRITISFGTFCFVSHCRLVRGKKCWAFLCFSANWITMSEP